MKREHRKGWKGSILEFDLECLKPGIGKGRRDTSTFPFVLVIAKFTSMTGVKASVKYKFMLKDEWVQNAQTAAFGSFTEVEAKDQWDVWMNDRSDLAPRKDKNGPRGMERIEVEVGSFTDKFTTNMNSRELQGDVKKMKKPTDEDLEI